MSWTYVAAPVLAWLVAGTLKFSINSLRLGKPAFGQIGLGGFPSTHACIAATVTALIGFRTDMGPAFAVALGWTTLTVLDALDLRRKVGRIAEAVNRLDPQAALRTRMGHSVIEVLGGLLLGVLLGWLLAAA